MPPPKQAPHVGVDTIAPASTKTSSSPSAQRLAVDALGRRHDDQRGSRGGRGGRAASRRPGAGRSSCRSRSCRCRPGRSCVPTASSIGTTLPGRCGRATSGRAPARSISPRLRELGVRIGALGRPGALGAALEVRRRSSRRPGRCRSPRPPRPPCSRPPAARRSTAPPRPRRRTRARSSSPPPTPISPMTARIRSLPATNGRFSPVNSTWIVAGTACQNSPKREAGGDVGRAEAGAERAERAVVHVCESPPAITEPGTTQPSSTRSVCSIPPRPWS